MLIKGFQGAQGEEEGQKDEEAQQDLGKSQQGAVRVDKGVEKNQQSNTDAAQQSIERQVIEQKDIEEKNIAQQNKSSKYKIKEMFILYLIFSFVGTCLLFFYLDELPSDLTFNFRFDAMVYIILFYFYRAKIDKFTVNFSQSVFMLFLFKFLSIFEFLHEALKIFSCILFCFFMSYDIYNYFCIPSMKEKTFLFSFQNIEEIIFCYLGVLLIASYKLQMLDLTCAIALAAALILYMVLNSRKIKFFSDASHFNELKKISNFIAICALTVSLAIFYKKLAAEGNILIIVHLVVLVAFILAKLFKKLDQFLFIIKAICCYILVLFLTPLCYVLN